MRWIVVMLISSPADRARSWSRFFRHKQHASRERVVIMPARVGTSTKSIFPPPPSPPPPVTLRCISSAPGCGQGGGGNRGGNRGGRSGAGGRLGDCGSPGTLGDCRRQSGTLGDCGSPGLLGDCSSAGMLGERGRPGGLGLRGSPGGLGLRASIAQPRGEHSILAARLRRGRKQTTRGDCNMICTISECRFCPSLAAPPHSHRYSHTRPLRNRSIKNQMPNRTRYANLFIPTPGPRQSRGRIVDWGGWRNRGDQTQGDERG